MTMLKNSQRDTTCYVSIASIGHSGSTLLGMILDREPCVTAIGELKNLAKYAADPTLRCACGTPVVECEFWRKVEAELQSKPENARLRLADVVCDSTLPRHPLARFPTISEFLLVLGSRRLWNAAAGVFGDVREKATFGRQGISVYEAVAASQDTRFIVDSPTTATYVKVLYFAAPEQFKCVELVRDGRGWCYSLMRREQVEMEHAARLWHRRQKNMRLALRTIPGSQRFQIKYEELCTSTGQTISRIGQFLGLPDAADTASERAEFQKQDFHGVGGNPMRFRYDETTIQLDEKWRTALTKDQVATFERIGGAMNRQLGYV